MLVGGIKGGATPGPARPRTIHDVADSHQPENLALASHGGRRYRACPAGCSILTVPCI